MSKKESQYYTVEHIWRLLRAAFLLLGTWLWLYSSVSPDFIFSCFLLAAAIDQLHGTVCHLIEKAFKYTIQHKIWG